MAVPGFFLLNGGFHWPSRKKKKPKPAPVVIPETQTSSFYTKEQQPIVDALGLKYQGTDHDDLPRDKKTGKPLYLSKNRYRKWRDPKCDESIFVDKCLLKKDHDGYCEPDKKWLKLEHRGY